MYVYYPPLTCCTLKTYKTFVSIIYIVVYILVVCKPDQLWCLVQACVCPGGGASDRTEILESINVFIVVWSF